MREKIFLLCLLSAMSFCVRTPTDAEKIIEGGIEVVINPYNLDPKEPLFSLEEEFVIDLEEEEMAALGLTDVWGFDVDFEEIRELDRFKIVQPIQADKVRIPMHVSVWCASYDRIYIGNEGNGYEVYVYDLDGNLLRKIRKKYEPVKVDEDYKKEIGDKLENTPDALKNKIYLPDYYPPFNYLFSDDKNNLYVKTFAKGDSPKDRLFDVFNPEGIFQGTVSIEAHVNDPFFTPGAPFDSWVMAKKKNRLYCLREKSSGYKEFVVYRLD